MRTARTVIAVAALALVAAFGAQAQKTDKAAAQTTGEMSPQQKVEEGVVKGAKPAPSTVDSKQLKKEAAAATKTGATNAGECGPEQKMDAGVCKKVVPASTKSKAEVKKEGEAAAKAGATTAKGEKP